MATYGKGKTMAKKSAKATKKTAPKKPKKGK